MATETLTSGEPRMHGDLSPGKDAASLVAKDRDVEASVHQQHKNDGVGNDASASENDCHVGLGSSDEDDDDAIIGPSSSQSASFTGSDDFDGVSFNDDDEYYDRVQMNKYFRDDALETESTDDGSSELYDYVTDSTDEDDDELQQCDPALDGRALGFLTNLASKCGIQ